MLWQAHGVWLSPIRTDSSDIYPGPTNHPMIKLVQNRGLVHHDFPIFLHRMYCNGSRAPVIHQSENDENSDKLSNASTEDGKPELIELGWDN